MSFRPPQPAHRLIARAEALLLLLTITTGFGAWAVGIWTLGYDYDEVMRTHSIWLAAQGLCPYRDFLDCHPPYFALLAPIARRCARDPCALLLSLRIASAAANILFLGGLAALGASSVASGRLWAVLGLVLVAFHPAVLEFLAEFRIDGWAYALTAWSLYRFRRLPRGIYRDFELGVLTGIASLFLCPKLALLPPLVILSEQVVNWQSARSAACAGLSYAAGGGVAAGLFALFLKWQGIDFDRAFQMVVRYNAISNSNLGFRFGLLQNILHIKVLFGMILAGLLAWAARHFRHGSRPDADLVALAAWLVIQTLFVSYPYKQYYAPWFLLASVFLAYLGQGLCGLLGCARVPVFVMACAVSVLADCEAARRWSDIDRARTDQRLIRWMNRVTRPEDRVVASPPLHPIDRYDSFFLWFNTLDPGGFDAEQILSRLPSYRRDASPGRFVEELEEHPPALVVLSGDWRIVPYTSGQREVLTDFLRRHAYMAVQVGTVRFALRPDRFEQARDDGLLEPVLGPSAAPPG